MHPFSHCKHTLRMHISHSAEQTSGLQLSILMAPYHSGVKCFVNSRSLNGMLVIICTYGPLVGNQFEVKLVCFTTIHSYRQAAD